MDEPHEHDKPTYVPVFADVPSEAFDRGVDAGIAWLANEASRRGSPELYNRTLACERLRKELASSRENWHAEHRRAAECIERLELESLALKRRISELEASEQSRLDWDELERAAEDGDPGHLLRVNRDLRKRLDVAIAKANELPGLTATLDELRWRISELEGDR